MVRKPPPGSLAKYEFITFSKLDKMRDAKAKSTIRKHAMKDIGISRRKPKKNQIIEIPLDVTALMHPAPSWWLGHSPDPFVKYPMELSRDGHELIANSKFSSQKVTARC
jgi:hypothetical protein